MTNQAAQTMHPDALPDGSLSKSTAKRVEALASASVSERARELLADEYERANFPDVARTIREGGYRWDSIRALELRAIEQALTQQRGSASYDAGMAMHWIERYAAGIDEECQLDRIAEAFTTPQPSADAVREVPEGMVLVPRELLWRVLDSVDVTAMADASDELRSILETK
jgi:hypothetical protein